MKFLSVVRRKHDARNGNLPHFVRHQVDTHFSHPFLPWHHPQRCRIVSYPLRNCTDHNDIFLMLPIKIIYPLTNVNVVTESTRSMALIPNISMWISSWLVTLIGLTCLKNRRNITWRAIFKAAPRIGWDRPWCHLIVPPIAVRCAQWVVGEKVHRRL